MAFYPMLLLYLRKACFIRNNYIPFIGTTFEVLFVILFVTIYFALQKKLLQVI